MELKLCLVETLEEQDLWGQENWLSQSISTKEIVTPLIDHPHSDKENGQQSIHYHSDDRYVYSKGYSGIQNIRITLPLKKNQRLEKIFVTKVYDKVKSITDSQLIKKSKLKHKCIYKSKCPHRGYDLSNEKPDKNGIITCPLHGLKFDSTKNNTLINDPTN